MAMDPTECNAQRIDELVEDFVEKIRHGEAISVEQFVEDHPDVASQLRDLLPAMLALEKCANTAPTIGALPERIGDFQIRERLGHGGMGIVYRAVQESLDREVALKVLSDSQLANLQARERFVREGKAVAKLRHDHIVPIFEIGSCEGVDYLCMQLIEGCTLQQLMEAMRERQKLRDQKSAGERDDSTMDAMVNTEQQSTQVRSGTKPDRIQTASVHRSRSITTSVAAPFSEEHWAMAARIGRSVAGGLHHAHEEGVLHRDVKPSNVMIESDGKCWVTDFGLAKTEDSDLTRTGVAVGTLRYMAPEQLLGQPTARSDIYSFGVMLSELLTLERPEEISIARVPTFSADSWKPVPTSLRAIALRCSAAPPESRYQSFAAVVADLDGFSSGQPIAARAPGATERTWWWIQRKKALTVACLALCLLTSMFGIYVFQQRRAAPVVLNGIELYPGGEDREVAEWVLQRGTVTVLNGDGLVFVDPWTEDEDVSRELPDGVFNLRAIHLTECEDLDEEMLRRFVRLPRLQILHLDHCRFEESWTKHLTEAPEIEYLNLYGCHLTDQAMPDLAEMNLAYLGLTDNDITNEGVALLRPTGLDELKLADNPQITDEVFEGLRKNTQLAYLEVIGTSVSEEAARAFEAKMKSRVGENAVVVGPKNDRPELINGYEIYTHGPDREVATWVLEQGGRVWIVSELGPQVVQRGHSDAIIEHELPNTPFHLKDIDLSGVETLDENIVRHFPNIPRLETLLLGGSNFGRGWVHYLARCDRLRYLNLGSCGITDAETTDLSSIPLNYLGLNHNHVTDDGIEKLAANKELIELTLAGNTKVSDVAFKALRRIPALALLDVSSTGVTEDAAAQFEDLLRRRGVSTEPKVVRGSLDH